MVDARDGSAHSSVARTHDVRQGCALISQAALNAILNGTSAVLLVCGYAAIRAGKMKVHTAFMDRAFFVSTAFLISYLIYHYRVGHVPFAGQGWIRPVYFAILISHTM